MGHTLSRAFRSVRMRPYLSFSIILLLCLGIGLAISTFGLSYYVLFKSLPYDNGESLVFIHDVYTTKSDSLLGVSEPEFFDYRNLSQSFEGISAIAESRITLLLPEPRRVAAASVSANLLDVLGARPQLGRDFIDDDDRPGGPLVALASARLFKEVLGCRNVDVCNFRANGSLYSVVGVLPDGFRLPEDLVSADQTEILFPLRLNPADLSYRDNPRLSVVARLKEGTTLDDAQREMGEVAQRLTSQYPEVYKERLGYTVQIEALRKAVLGNASYAFILSSLVASILFFVAVANVSNILLISNDHRTPALLTSIALGAPLRALRVQLLAESILFSALAFLPGILLGWGLFMLVARFSAGRFLPLLRDARFTPEVVIFGFTLLTVASLIMFLLPQTSLLRAQRLLPSIGREARSSSGPARIRLQSMLLAGQATLSTALIALFLLVALSQHRLRNSDLGFNPDGVNVTEIPLPIADYSDNERVLGFYTNALSQVRLEGSSSASCLATSPPLVQRNETWPFDIADQATGGNTAPPAFVVEIMSGGCLGVLGIPLVEGADFPLDKRPDQEPVALVSINLARRIWSSPKAALGQRIRPRLMPNAPWVRVVGVIGDVRHEGPNAPELETVYLHYNDIPALTTASVRSMRMLSRSHEEATGDLQKRIARTVRTIDPMVPVEHLGTLSNLRARLTASWRFTGQILTLASLLGPLIALSGLYSLLSTLITLRRRELGIRMALGATQRNILLFLSRQAVTRLALGGVIGICLSLVVFSRLRDFLPSTAFSEAVLLSLLGFIALTSLGIIASASLVPSIVSKLASLNREA